MISEIPVDICVGCPAANNICEAGPDEACEQFTENLRLPIDKLQRFLQLNCTVVNQDNKWHLFTSSGEGLFSGNTLYDLIRAISLSI